MTYFLISNRQLITLQPDPGLRPVAIGPDGRPIYEIDIEIGEDPDEMDPPRQVDVPDPIAAED